MKIIVKEEGLKSIGSNLINNSEELNSEVEKINAAWKEFLMLGVARMLML